MFSTVSSRLLNRSFARSVLARSSRVRNMGSQGAKEGPYSVPKGEAYPNEAYPLGMVPGKKSEGWEGITYACYLGCTLWLVLGLSTKENDGFKVCNRPLVEDARSGFSLSFLFFYFVRDRPLTQFPFLL